MTRKFVLAFLATLAVSASLFGETGRYMVVMRRSAPATSLRLVANSAESIAHRVRRFDHAGSMAMDLTAAEAAELRRSGDVLSVEPVVRMEALEAGTTVTPHLSYEQQIVPWGVATIHAPAVWPATRGKNVNVAVIDSGIDMMHPDLIGAYAGGFNEVDPTKPPLDDHGHGTHVSGIIAAADNSFGIVGVAPEVKLWALKVLASDGVGSDERVVAALDWIIAKKREIGGPWVANMSFGGPPSNALAQGVQRALDAGIVLVAASGNTSGLGPLLHPAGYEGVISVGAVDSQGNVAPFSTYGLGLDVVAPGVDVQSTYLRDKLTLAEVEAQGTILPAYPISNSPMLKVQGPFVNCGFGRPQDFPTNLAGRVCVIERSPASPEAIPFSEKARNAKEAGAVAVIIYNDNDQARSDYRNWTLYQNPEEEPYDFPLTVAMSYADGSKLLNTLGGTIRVAFGYREYLPLNGTSMAAPHVSGTVALLLALKPGSNFSQILSLLEQTTSEISVRGWDARSAWGMVDAFAAARALAPAAFGLTPQPPPVIRRRSTRS